MESVGFGEVPLASRTASHNMKSEKGRNVQTWRSATQRVSDCALIACMLLQLLRRKRSERKISALVRKTAEVSRAQPSE